MSFVFSTAFEFPERPPCPFLIGTCMPYQLFRFGITTVREVVDRTAHYVFIGFTVVQWGFFWQCLKSFAGILFRFVCRLSVCCGWLCPRRWGFRQYGLGRPGFLVPMTLGRQSRWRIGWPWIVASYGLSFSSFRFT